MQLNTDTIAAIATPPGRGGVGIVRVSGKKAKAIAQQILGFEPKVRFAHYCPFKDENDEVLDEGLALFFEGPNSFTGEDVLELQGHGGPVILDFLLQRVLALGARAARPGEFSERAFLNDKMDLTQAEAIADLIDSASEQAARCAVRSLQGAFSQRVKELVDALINLRIYVEAAIDFPEEEIDFLSDGKVEADLHQVMDALKQVQQEANQGSILREGMTVVIAGRPNAGKSSLLNALAGRDTAIVTHIAGTTRDVLREHIHIDGMPLHIIDTAGLRDAPDEVERIGIERAWQEIEQADRVLLMVDSTETDATDPKSIWPEFVDKLPHPERITVIRNKVDLTNEKAGMDEATQNSPIVRLAAKQGDGVTELREHLKTIMGYSATSEGGFIARRRHIEALNQADTFLQSGRDQLLGAAAGELLAEDLRMAQNALNEITGEFSSDDLLGKIFGSFCIGK
ncbi:tRNA uridine-5-carboxymethylaminomethyl(34) synthesis GTPase MnmE [Bermanella marisrubri]|uniref:tRNA modification GTPase MnmE n=1 Tax=Bermanella marisrubri TaxID=207949 RepID=Q1MZ44_9GAMM|nr:tRNA uridine-5-carboxymethylaminomethyl(34) synthesis GTPase MnmE [Bermanella marisrubri]EAT11289.1 tRNA modification GTPase [Oceanobacter sp. RED65] [Bermanella marisrubri]QIZ82770.1 tRNA uridine-5-carboxymethylaminomethyl(34) synthesis GTPase MnmE [Bermanella marisrubri]